MNSDVKLYHIRLCTFDIDDTLEDKLIVYSNDDLIKTIKRAQKLLKTLRKLRDRYDQSCLVEFIEVFDNFDDFECTHYFRRVYGNSKYIINFRKLKKYL